MAVTTFDPRCRVLLKKNIGRSSAGDGIAVSQRFTGTQRVIDLTPMLGEGSSVVVQKSVRGAPAGSFNIMFPDQMVQGQQESLYGLIEPMDIIEISMAHDASKYGGLGPPIMMRGLVTDIGRSQTISSGGPRNAVLVAGHDYGKIFQILRVDYNFNSPIGTEALTAFALFERYGVQAKADQPAGEFIQDVVDKAINPFIEQMIDSPVVNGLAGPASPIQLLGTDIVDPGGVISPFGSQAYGGGSIWELISYFGDVGPFNELFVEDPIGSTQPILVYRPNPFMDLKGNWITAPYSTNSATRPAFVDVVDSDIIAMSSRRSDSSIFNYYWVDAPTMALADYSATLLQQTADRSSIFVTSEPNVSPELYGVRKLVIETQQGARFDGQPAVEQRQTKADGLAFLQAKRAALLAQNVDNVVLESGAMTMRGDETIRAGNYLRVHRGTAQGANLTSVAYCPAVTHQFIPYGSYTTSINFDRGTSFVERIQRGTGVSSPYLAEQNPGGVYAR